MGTFGATKVKKFSMGNRIAYKYNLTNVQTSGSILRVPFKKITGYMIETTDPNTSTIAVATNSEKTATNKNAALTFKATAESQGNILVVGLL